jgi:hypothetical protein
MGIAMELLALLAHLLDPILEISLPMAKEQVPHSILQWTLLITGSVRWMSQIHNNASVPRPSHALTPSIGKAFLQPTWMDQANRN